MAALARKYRALVALRARRDAGGAGGGPGVVEELRALAREFPGCLRELDTLGTSELARRAETVEAALERGGAHEEWMAWIWGYHRLMRAALALRRGEGAGAGGAGAGGAGGAGGAELDAEFVAEVTAPPHGRLGVVVLRRLARDHARPAKAIAAALFPVRRPSPYEL